MVFKGRRLAKMAKSPKKFGRLQLIAFAALIQ